MRDLVADGNSVLLVDHDTQILREADWIIEMGPDVYKRQCLSIALLPRKVKAGWRPRRIRAQSLVLGAARRALTPI